jgi:hypothetical protein
VLDPFRFPTWAAGLAGEAQRRDSGSFKIARLIDTHRRFPGGLSIEGEFHGHFSWDSRMFDMF